MSTYLAPASSSRSSSLASSPSLALLPFSLGPAHTPFASSSTPTAKFFQPRPCPSDVPGIAEHTPIAAFRGRQLVGQAIDVPQGYQGVILSAPLPHHMESKWPITPAASVASVSDINKTAQDGPTASSSSSSSGPSGTRKSPRKSTLANVANTIKAKVKGAGQIALSRPKTRQPKTQPVKRKYQFDSEEEGEEGHVEHAKIETPTKPKYEESAETSTGMEVDLPTIVVQDATPLKEPLPTPKKRLGERGAVGEGLPLKRRRSCSRSSSRSASPDGSPSPSPSPSPISESTPQTVSEGIIPSPATEDDPPAFDSDSIIKTDRTLPTSAPSSASIKTEVDEPKEEQEPRVDVDHDEFNNDLPPNARLLRPISRFESFMLWTPDIPIPGFRSDELDSQPSVLEENGGVASDNQGAAGAGSDGGGDEVEKVNEGGVKLRKGWWRTGGAGEGGDEVVRALGEWIGLIEELNRPVYLDDTKDDDSDTD